MIWKACSRCGKLHPIGHTCNVGKVFKGGEERKLRATNRWHEKSREIRERANNLCEVCRDENVYTYDNLEVHHIEKLRDRDDLLLDNYNLICLCQFHHHLAERGDIDKEYLLRLAREREER